MPAFAPQPSPLLARPWNVVARQSIHAWNSNPSKNHAPLEWRPCRPIGFPWRIAGSECAGRFVFRFEATSCQLAFWASVLDKVPRHTSTAGPVMITQWPGPAHSTCSAPPGNWTWHFWDNFPSSAPATTTAHAPVPHARVIPLPRSHVRIVTRESLSRCAKCALIRCGNAL